MASLKEVKNRISSVVSTQQITKAMKMVAAAKLRKSQDRIHEFRPFAAKISTLLQKISSSPDVDPSESWFSRQREEKGILIVPINSDRGLCGSFNSSVHRAVIRLIDQKYREQHRAGNVTILPLGKKSHDFFKKNRYTIIGDFWHVFKELSFEAVSAAADAIMDDFRKGKFDKVEIVYNEFRNVATQILRVEQFLPVVPSEDESESSAVDYIYQPDQQVILQGLIPKTLRTQLFKASLDSNAAENGARMTAMDKATDNAGELLRDLRLSYNRTRQAAITKEILEIVSGAEALRAS